MELVSNLSGLLCAVLTDGSPQLYKRTWVVFRQFHGSEQLTLLLPQIVFRFSFHAFHLENHPFQRLPHICRPLPKSTNLEVFLTQPNHS